jgi:hypothetical protein
MGKLKYKQSGFSAVEALLILVIVGIVGFTGWYVYHAQTTANKYFKPTNSGAPAFKNNSKKAATNHSADKAKTSNTTQVSLGTTETSADGKVQVVLPVGWTVTSRVDGDNTCGFAPPAPGTCITDINFEDGSLTSSKGYVKMFNTSENTNTWHQAAIGDCGSPQTETVNGNPELICTINPDGGKDYTVSNGSYIAYLTGDGSSGFLSIVESVKFP